MLASIVLSSITKKGEIVRKMAPLGHCLWFWWLNNNTINGTNEFVKWTLIDPRDEAKRPSKAKHEERTQRNKELDEFYKNQLHRLNRWVSTGLSGGARMHQCHSTGAICNAGARRSVTPDALVVLNWSTGASTMLLLREHVKRPGRSSSAPVEPVVHRRIYRCNAVTVAKERSNTGWTEDKAPVYSVTLQKTQWLPRAQSGRMHRCYTFGYTSACAESWVIALNG